MKNYELVFEHDFKLYCREFNTETTESTVFEVTKNNYIPDIFIPTNFNSPSEYKAFDTNFSLEQIHFKTSYDYYDYIKNSKDEDLYGNKSFVQKYIREKYRHQIGFNADINSRHLMRTWFLDIEVRIENGYAKPSNPTEKICMIQLYDNYSKMYIVLAVEPDNFNLKFSNTKYIKCEDEIQLLTRFTQLINKFKPTIICGFNSDMFDIPYITNRMELIGLNPRDLSPIKEIKTSKNTTADNIEFRKYEWLGIIFMDYRELYQKYTLERLPKMNLETIATYELGEGKVLHSEYDNLEELYNKDFKKYVEYGIRDVEILVELDSKLRLLEVAQNIGYLCGVNMNEVLKTLFQWQSLMYNTAIENKLVLPIKQKHTTEGMPYVGGWVKATPGNHKNVYSYDFTSLYPSNIRSLSIGLENYLKPKPDLLILKKLGVEGYSYPEDIKWLLNEVCYWYKPENANDIAYENDNDKEFEYFCSLMANKDEIIKVLKKYNLSMAPNGCLFIREDNILSNLMTLIFNKRVEAKKLMKDKSLSATERAYYDLQQKEVLKKLMNSCYGSLALPYNNFSFGKMQSAAITTTGRLFNRWVAHKVGLFLNKKSNSAATIQADTDSNYFIIPDGNLEEVYTVIKKAITEVEELLNVYKPGILDMEQENSFKNFISLAPKRYIGDKGNGKYKFTGVTIIDKSTSKWAKDELSNILPLIFNSNTTEIIKVIDRLKQDIKKLPLDKICPIKGVNNLNYKLNRSGKYVGYDGKPCPINSRGSIIHNNVIDKFNINHNKIIEGDKVYILYMKPCDKLDFNNVICFKNIEFIKDAKLTEFIDWEKMFIKAFSDKLDTIIKPLGLDLNPYSNVLDLWS